MSLTSLRTITCLTAFLTLAAVACCHCQAHESDQWVRYSGKDGAGKGKHILFIAGDE